MQDDLARGVRMIDAMLEKADVVLPLLATAPETGDFVGAMSDALDRLEAAVVQAGSTQQ